MKISVLERILAPERMRQKASLAPPLANRRASTREEGPWIVSNTKGVPVLTALRTDPSTNEEMVTQAFFECPIDEEDNVIHRLFLSVLYNSRRFEWRNRCRTLAEAIPLMLRLGYEPKYLIVPFADLAEVCGEALTEEDAEKLALVKGSIAEVNGVKVLFSSGIPTGCALLTTDPTLTGHYMRSYDHLSVLVHRADRSVVLVSHDEMD